MASAIAHEINQPLTAISMYSQTGLRLLNQKPPQNERCLDVLYKLSIQAHRAGAIIEHSQRFSRQNESHREEVDCNVLLREVHKLAEVEARIRDIVIILQLAGLLPMVVCDPVQIQQVVLNLLRNGMESMKEAGYKRGNRIVVQTHRSDIGVKISVIDSGTGITADVAEQLYRPFSTTKDTGTGIGLSISRTIIRAHGAQLKFLNNENGGVTFYFTLPYTTYKKHD
jgi:two-component system sensor kinase FixL